MIKKWLFYFLIFFFAFSSSADILTVKGVGETKDIALRKALSNAAVQASGVKIQSFTKLVNTLVSHSVVTSEITGTINNWEILEEDKNEFGAVELTVKVDVGEEAKQTARDKVQLIQGILGKMKVVVSINEIMDNTTSIVVVNEIIERKLREAGFSIVDKKRLDEIRAENLEIFGDEKQTRAFYIKNLKANLMIEGTGNAIFKIENPDIPLFKYIGDIQLRVVSVDTGDILTSQSAQKMGSDSTKEAAARVALKNAAEDVVDLLIEDMVIKWMDRILNAETFSFEFQNIPAEIWFSLENQIKNISGVQSVQFQDWVMKTGSADIEYAGKLVNLVKK